MARILLCHEFFWPDAAPYGSILKAIGEQWLESGQHDVFVFTSRPDGTRSLGQLSFEDEDSKTELKIYRTTLPFPSKSKSKIARFLNSLMFATKFIWFARKNAPFDLILNSTMPPLFAGVAGSFASRFSRSGWIHHIMDIYPEVIGVSEVRTKSILYRFLLRVLTRIDSWAVSKADRIIVLSEDMRQTMLDRGVDSIRAEQILVQPNFALPDWSKNDSSNAVTIPWGHGVAKIVFAGNLGRFQGLDKILQGFISAKETGASCELAFIGDGLMAEELRLAVLESGVSGVHFSGLLSRSDADRIIRDVDIGIVSLAYGVERVAFPTKTGSYLVNGKAIFALGKRGSSLQLLVDENNIGCFADIETVSDIAKAFLRLSKEENRTEWTRSAEKYGQRYLPERSFPFWNTVLDELLSRIGKPGKSIQQK